MIVNSSSYNKNSFMKQSIYYGILLLKEQLIMLF